MSSEFQERVQAHQESAQLVAYSGFVPNMTELYIGLEDGGTAVKVLTRMPGSRGWNVSFNCRHTMDLLKSRGFRCWVWKVQNLNGELVVVEKMAWERAFPYCPTGKKVEHGYFIGGDFG